MPSAEHLKEKQAVVAEIREKLDKARSAVVIDYIGITVAEADAMRRKLREAEVDYTVYKNKLVERAIVGTDYAQLGNVLSGPSAFAIGYSDAIAPARVLNDIIKEYKKMEFKAGVIEGTFYDAEGLKLIASLPTRDELIARFLGSILSPVGKLVRTLKAVADDKESGGGPAPAAPPEAEPAAQAAAEAAPAPAPEAEAAAEAAPAAPEAEAAPAPAAEAPEAAPAPAAPSENDAE
ncbi:MAG: 50S ribosomal protein L10 [Clostridiales Family XIII bacterium]|jgi:large subunit ribosomal protein L10|nr:50S ribosomal protein L10 [Clostridiales Family XIII bacterium]